MVTILKNNETLTPYKFYSSFLREVANYIKESNSIEFKLVEYGDEKVFDSTYRIDPITIPLLLSLFEQLSKFYKKPLHIALYNNLATKSLLKFLSSSDFFHIAGNSTNPHYPPGRALIEFNKTYLGDFEKKEFRPDHRVRCYSLSDNNLSAFINAIENEDDRRDFLLSEYTYIVREHFEELLFDNSNTLNTVDHYVEILSELVTNGVLHSKSDTFALMFVNRFVTKFSISDNGIGFEKSLSEKKPNFLYIPFELKSELDALENFGINKKIVNNLNTILEILYYSSLKSRKGLFDLLISVVLNSNGYFRLHSENAQIIVSNRMRNDLNELSNLRNQIFDYHRSILINNLSEDFYKGEMIEIKDKIKSSFRKLYSSIFEKYNNDYKYSSIRFFNVKFRGVHIEVEIPNEQL